MINFDKLKPVLAGYLTYFPKYFPHGEDFKWEAVQHFRNHWDLNAQDFGAMFKEATSKVDALLDTGYAYPRAMILNFAAADPEATREMFRNLFHGSQELPERIKAFLTSAESLRSQYDDGSWHNHYQNTSAISVYLWLKYPDQYYVYRYSVSRDIANELEFDAPPKRDGSTDSLLNSYRLYEELRTSLSKTEAITQMISQTLKTAPAGKYWPDTHWNTAAVDLGFYLSRYYLNEKKAVQNQSGWFPSKEEYDHGRTMEQSVERLFRFYAELPPRHEVYAGLWRTGYLQAAFGQIWRNNGVLYFAFRPSCAADRPKDGLSRHAARQ